MAILKDMVMNLQSDISAKARQKTEFQKIIEGWGDYFFYGFASGDGMHLEKWFIGDYNMFRKFVYLEACKNGMNSLKRRVQENSGGYGSSFLAFKQNEIPGFVVASSEDGIYKMIA